ncbi:MAG: hypothetical protein HY289_12490 [Planctomycetes bacterium]|nr:hypothetical protein [Planctomycetota bacterium]
MMTLTRRFLLLTALMFWQGGFLFYAAVVIHVGRIVLGSHLQQGFITQSVTNYLNLGGAIALSIWGWDVVSARDSHVRRRRFRVGLWLLLVLTLGILTRLHVRMDEMLAVEPMRVVDPDAFYGLHRWYLHISTVQWVASLVLTALTLLAWRREDSAPREVYGQA